MMNILITNDKFMGFLISFKLSYRYPNKDLTPNNNLKYIFQ